MNRLLAFLFSQTYSLLFFLGRHFLLPLVRLFPFSRGWDLPSRCRVTAPPPVEGDTGRVWIHAASLGEARLLFSLKDILVHLEPKQCFVCTSTTRTGYAFLQKYARTASTTVCFLPLDSPGLMRRFLRNYNIRRVWLLESELWPGMLMACRKEAVPIGLVNARMEKKTAGRYRFLSRVCSPLFADLAPVLAQTPEYAERFARCGVPHSRIKVTGNLKMLVPLTLPPSTRRSELRRRLHIGPKDLVLTAGSLHPTEGRVLAEACRQLRTKVNTVRLIAVPRHLKCARSLVEELGEETHSLDSPESATPFQSCVIARFGILDDMYACADVAFVGGTFVSIGGHNVWEPARFGIPVFFGPDYHTQTIACDKLRQGGIAECVSDASSLARAIIFYTRENTAGFLAARDSFWQSIGHQRSLFEEALQ